MVKEAVVRDHQVIAGLRSEAKKENRVSCHYANTECPCCTLPMIE